MMQDGAGVGADAEERDHPEIEIAAIAAEQVPGLRQHDIQKDRAERAEHEELPAEGAVEDQRDKKCTPTAPSQAARCVSPFFVDGRKKTENTSAP